METTRRKMEKELPLAEEVFQVIGAAMEVHRELGAGFLEAVYAEAFALELEERRIPFRAEAILEVYYKQRILKKHYVADVIAFNDIIIELKSMPALTSREMAQLLNYLRATLKPVGLLINFGSPGKLEWKRLANTRALSRPS